MFQQTDKTEKMSDFYYVLTYKGEVFAGIIDGLLLFVPQELTHSFIRFLVLEEALSKSHSFWEEYGIPACVEFSDCDEFGNRFVESIESLM